MQHAVHCIASLIHLIMLDMLYLLVFVAVDHHSWPRFGPSAVVETFYLLHLMCRTWDLCGTRLQGTSCNPVTCWFSSSGWVSEATWRFVQLCAFGLLHNRNLGDFNDAMVHLKLLETHFEEESLQQVSSPVARTYLWVVRTIDHVSCVTYDIAAYCGGGMVEFAHFLQDGVAGSSDGIAVPPGETMKLGQLELKPELSTEALPLLSFQRSGSSPVA